MHNNSLHNLYALKGQGLQLAQGDSLGYELFAPLGRTIESLHCFSHSVDNTGDSVDNTDDSEHNSDDSN